MDLSNIKINFLGDSITVGSGASEPLSENGYVGRIAATGIQCRNYGIGGTRIAKQTAPSRDYRHDWDFCTRIEKMDPDADVIVIFGGTNDFGHGDAPLGEFSDRTTDTFYGALHCLYSGIITKYPEAKIVVVTPLHRTNELNPKGDGGKAQDVGTLKVYVDIIREVAEFYSLPILDLFKNSGIQPTVPIINELYFLDGLHPNDKGHQLVADMVINFLKQL